MQMLVSITDAQDDKNNTVLGIGASILLIRTTKIMLRTGMYFPVKQDPFTSIYIFRLIKLVWNMEVTWGCESYH